MGLCVIEGYVRPFWQWLRLVHGHSHLFANVLLEFLRRFLASLLRCIKVLLACADRRLVLVQVVQTLEDQSLQHGLVLLLVVGSNGGYLGAGLLEELIQELLATTEYTETGPVGEGGTGNLLRHGGLLELLLVERINGSGLLAHQLRLLDGEFLVGLKLDFAGLLQSFLSDERGHLAELTRNLGTTRQLAGSSIFTGGV